MTALLPVSAYAAKYGIPVFTVYSALYAGRIRGERSGTGWLVEDAPPPPRGAKKASAKVSDLSPYELALIWLGATISGDAVILRSKDGFVPSYFADKLGCALWQRESGSFVCKISSVSLVRSLRELGFTGRKDPDLAAPVGSGPEFAAAFVESRSSFVRQLRYDRRHPMDKQHAYYVPAITMCASYPMLETVAVILHDLGIIPPRQLYPAANRSSATLKITSRLQLDAIRNQLSAYGKNAVYWASFDRHISQAHQPYYAAKRSVDHD